jgi:polysaccharide chain length determinant protein (PEP-CTERM system associated)
MLPGKKYTPEDILQIIWRHIWFLLVPFAVVSAGTALYARSLPDRYRSEALIMVVPQRVPEAYVRSTVTTRLDDRIRNIREQILSRPRLERIILDLDLYADLRRSGGIMQDVVERMQREVTVTPGQGNTFRIGFTADLPATARQVAQQITSLFMDESSRQRTMQAETTSQFLEAQLEDARSRLREQEQRLADYRMQFGGELPTQQDSNLQAASNLQMQIQALLQALNRHQDTRVALERQIAELEAVPMPVPVETPPPADGAGASTAQQLAQARAQLNVALGRYTLDHPDVKRFQAFVAELEDKAEAEALQRPLSSPGGGMSEAEQQRRKRLAELRNDLQRVLLAIQEQQTEERQLRASAAEYQRRAEAAPVRETELIEINRNYDVLNRQYSSLLTKLGDARMSENLERNQSGELFQTLDPARLPERPSSPNRDRMNYIGMAAGIGLGLALVALLEYRDRSFKTDDEIKTVLSLPVLAVVPFMRSEPEKRRARRRRVFVGVSLGGFVMGCLAVLAYTFVR